MREDRGATLVEYILVLVALVVLSVGGIRAIEAAGRSEVGNQADCIGKRPPPTTCRIPVASVTTRSVPAPSTTVAPEPTGPIPGEGEGEP